MAQYQAGLGLPVSVLGDILLRWILSLVARPAFPGRLTKPLGMTALPCRVQPFSTDPRREPSSCEDLRQDGQNDSLEPVRSTRYDSPGAIPTPQTVV